LALLTGFLSFTVPALAAETKKSHMQSVVRIEVRKNRNTVVSWGSGVILDANGSILTNAQVVKRAQQYPLDYTLTICSTVTLSSSPSCALHAVVTQTSEQADLALLQVSEVLTKEFGWISLDEYRLRHGKNPQGMSIATLHTTSTNAFPAELGEAVRIFGYTGAGKTMMSFIKADISGFETSLVHGVDLKARMNVDTKIAPGYAGGAVIDAEGRMIGVASASSTVPSMGSVTTLPLIGSFLRDSLGSAYVSTTHLKLPSLEGVFGGYLPKAASCPMFSSLDSSSRLCQCDTGFFAVNNTCIVGAVYCKIKGGDYDSYRQACLNIKLPAKKETTKTVTKPAEKPAVKAPVIAATTSTPAFPPVTTACKGNFQLGKQCIERRQYCAAWRLNGVFNATKKVCECPKGKAPDPKTGRCVR